MHKLKLIILLGLSILFVFGSIACSYPTENSLTSHEDNGDGQLVEDIPDEGLDKDSKLVIKENTCDIFMPSEASIMGINLYDTLDTLIEKVGEPNTAETVFEGYIGADIYYYHYDFGEIRLVPDSKDVYRIFQLDVWEDNAKGPRDIKIGDSVQLVIDKFHIDGVHVADQSNLSLNAGKTLYQINEETMGIISADSNNIIDYVLYQYVDISYEKFEAVSLRFNIDDDKVTAISVAVIHEN